MVSCYGACFACHMHAAPTTSAFWYISKSLLFTEPNIFKSPNVEDHITLLLNYCKAFQYIDKVRSPVSLIL